MIARRLLLAGAVAAATAVTASAVTVTDHTVARPEGPRHYILVEPDGAAPGKRPLVILLHGHGTSAALMVGLASFAGYKSQAWSALAARENVLLLAPDGAKASDGKNAWNDCRTDAPTNTTVDDVGLIAALIDTAVAEHGADPARVYVYGSSHGGGMAYRAGIELAPRLAAIGVQSGMMAAQNGCPAPMRPLPVFIAHGTADEIVPYTGGKLGSWMLKGRGTAIGTEAAAGVWRRLDGLPETPVTFRFPHLHPDDPTSATRIVWGSDPAGLQVELLRIDGGGHAEAARDGELPWLLRKLVGAMNHDVDTVEEAWAFFKTRRNAAAAR